VQPVHDEQDEQQHDALRDRKRQASSEYQELSQELGSHGVLLRLSFNESHYRVLLGLARNGIAAYRVESANPSHLSCSFIPPQSLSEERFDLGSLCSQSMMSRMNSSTMGTNDEMNTTNQDMAPVPFV
jgi:hypothetical protein